MREPQSIAFEFVENIPDQVRDHILYVSVRFATAIHKCACGCGQEVVTPLSPADWALTFDGESVSLDPSIGSWDLPCQSHYWIDSGRIEWAAKWSRKMIRDGKARDRLRTKRYFDSKQTVEASRLPGGETTITAKAGLWNRIKRLWARDES